MKLNLPEALLILASPVCFASLYGIFSYMGWMTPSGQLDFDPNLLMPAPFLHSMFTLSTFFLALVHAVWEWKKRRGEALLVLAIVTVELLWFITSFGAFWHLG